MKLYYLPGACSLASNIALREAGVPFEMVLVNRADKRTADGQDFNQVNTKGYVPTLQLDDGQVLTENVAVLSYIGSLKPEKKLAPAPGTLESYRLLEALSFVNSEIHKNMAALFVNKTEEVQQYAKGNLAKRLGWLDGALAGKTFFMGNDLTVADCYLCTALSWAPHAGVDLSLYPNVKAYYDRVAARPSVLAALKAEGLIK
jgi:glutathione S-transferase